MEYFHVSYELWLCILFYNITNLQAIFCTSKYGPLGPEPGKPCPEQKNRSAAMVTDWDLQECIFIRQFQTDLN